MFIYQNGKLYTQHGDKLVGVEIYSDKVIVVEGTETTLADSYETFTPFEVRCKWNIESGGCYIFPKDEIEVKEKVEEIEPVKPVKRPYRKSTRK